MSVLKIALRSDKSTQANFNDFLQEEDFRIKSRNSEKEKDLFHSLDFIRRGKDFKTLPSLPLKNKIVVDYILKSTYNCKKNIEDSKRISSNKNLLFHKTTQNKFFELKEKTLLSERNIRNTATIKAINGDNLNNKTFDSIYFSNSLRGTYYKGKLGRAKSIVKVTSKSYVKELLFKKLGKGKIKLRSVFPSINKPI